MKVASVFGDDYVELIPDSNFYIITTTTCKIC